MILCLDIGNTHILGGIYREQRLIARFRYATDLIGTADQFGIFLINFLQTHQLTAADVKAVAVCSVVPSCDYTIKHTFAMYFKAQYFILQPGVKTGLNIKYKNPNEVGADLIASAIGAMDAYPNKNIIIIDMGTATTVCAISDKHDFLGGTILPGMRLGMEALKSNTAKLKEVEIEVPAQFIGRTTRECIQTGLFYGQLGALKEIVAGFKREAFANQPVTIIGTGGFSQLFKDRALFDVILPDLVLQGLYKAYERAFSTV